MFRTQHENENEWWRLLFSISLKWFEIFLFLYFSHDYILLFLLSFAVFCFSFLNYHHLFDSEFDLSFLGSKNRRNGGSLTCLVVSHCRPHHRPFQRSWSNSFVYTGILLYIYIKLSSLAHPPLSVYIQHRNHSPQMLLIIHIIFCTPNHSSPSSPYAHDIILAIESFRLNWKIL